MLELAQDTTNTYISAMFGGTGGADMVWEWSTTNKRMVYRVKDSDLQCVHWQGAEPARANAGLANIKELGSGGGSAHQCLQEGLRAAADSLIQGNGSQVFGSSSKVYDLNVQTRT